MTESKPPAVKSIFNARLVNDPLGDPGLFIEFRYDKRALLIDLGDIHRLSAAKLLKVSDVFVSHTHMDHFIGFDRLLRLVFGQGKTIRLYGPVNFTANVRGKLAGFTWNLVDRYEESVNLEVTEVLPDRLLKTTFRAIDRFEPSAHRELPFDGRTLLEEESFRVETAILEHRVPCLGFTVIEKAHSNVDKEKLEALHLQPGPWVSRLKDYAQGEPYPVNIAVTVCDDRGRRTEERDLKALARELVVTTPGQKIAYITDTVYNPDNSRRIVDLVQGADLFFCESPFLAEEAERARDRCHLTSEQAGQLARRSGVRRLHVFHFSSRHTHQTHRLIQEALSAYRSEK